jgi:VTC domain-containing protein
MREFTYYETKYAVATQDLTQVRSVFEGLYGGTDPYPEGLVDSVYYDSWNALAYQECQDGDHTKAKLRVRRYSEKDGYGQLQIKKKDLTAVAKYKVRIRPIPAERIDDTEFQETEPGSLLEISSLTAQLGPISPFIRVKYLRSRYRMFDIRVTLDQHVEVFPLSGFPEAGLGYVKLPYHVLEVKSHAERPMLPVFGLLKLRPISYSKFHLGARLLQGLPI